MICRVRICVVIAKLHHYIAVKRKFIIYNTANDIANRHIWTVLVPRVLDFHLLYYIIRHCRERDDVRLLLFLSAFLWFQSRSLYLFLLLYRLLYFVSLNGLFSLLINWSVYRGLYLFLLLYRLLYLVSLNGLFSLPINWSGYRDLYLFLIRILIQIAFASLFLFFVLSGGNHPISLMDFAVFDNTIEAIISSFRTILCNTLYHFVIIANQF